MNIAQTSCVLATSNPPSTLAGNLFMCSSRELADQFLQLLPSQTWIEIAVDHPVSLNAGTFRAWLVYSSATGTFKRVFHTRDERAKWRNDENVHDVENFNAEVDPFKKHLQNGELPWVVYVEDGKAISARRAESSQEVLASATRPCHIENGTFHLWAKDEVSAIHEVSGSLAMTNTR
jgi:hypothetical protein